MALLLSRSSMLFGKSIINHAVAVRPARFASAVAAARAQAAVKEEKEKNTVGKGILAKNLAKELQMSEKQAGEVIETLLDDIMLSVAEGKTVTIPGFGSFKKKHRAARKGRNPSTGADLDIPAKDAPGFSAGSVFKGVVQAGSWEKYDDLVAQQKAAAPKKK
jgi:DNA-binding protein HU-beta